PSMQEIKEAVFNINKDSVAGPDGFTSFFYQQCWDIIKQDLLKAVLDFFKGSSLPRGVTSTTLVLLPKKSNACQWSDFRPISLCTVLNKIVTKILANRLSKFLPSLISENQSGFVNGRLISDNILLAQELIGKLDAKSRGGWENKILSPGGRITLLRSVLSSLPMYLLQVLKPPMLVIEKIERLFNSFLWGDSNESKRTHWAAWNKITYPCSEGGLEIRKLTDVFEAFTLKLWWRFQTCDSLWTQFLRTKYCLGQIPHYVQPKLHDSQVWKRMVVGRNVAIQNTRWKIGKGELFFWHDCWMGEQPLVTSFPSFQNDMSLVHEFYTGDTWAVDKLFLYLPRSLIDKILQIPFDRSQVDVAYWALTSNGEFSTWSAWEEIRQRQSPNVVGSFIWHRSIPLSISFFFWRVLNNWIPVELRMKEKGSLLSQWQWKGDTAIAVMWGFHFPPKYSAPPKIIHWIKPAIGEYKLNVDGSSRNGQNAASGGVLRDHTGKLVFGFSENIGPSNSLQAELHALLRGLLLCQERHIDNLWIEMDALVVIQMILRSQKGSHDIRYLLESIRKCLRGISYRISHIFREGNQAADFLSNTGYSHQDLRVITEAQGELFAFKGIGLVGVYEIRWLDYKHILIHLSNEQDLNRLWMRQAWFIANQKMRVFKWTPDFQPEKESSLVPVWISFPNLRAHLYEKSAQLMIAKSLGRPLFVDEATVNGTRSSVARACVEYDCQQPPLEQIWIVTRDRRTRDITGGFQQKVDFAKLPNYCTHCCHVGHSASTCLVMGHRMEKADNSNAQPYT
ncbi:Reverse transcriptase domain - like 10, partial [Theobroma cacao]